MSFDEVPNCRNLVFGGECALQITDLGFSMVFEDSRISHVERGVFCSVAYVRPQSLRHLAQKTGAGRKFIAKACKRLVEVGWLRLISQANILRPVCWVPHEQQRNMAKQLEREYDMCPFAGEFLFGRVLEYLVDVPAFIHNARPEFLKHPKTNEPLELDYFAPGFLGAEFHGQQHYSETKKYSKQVVADIKARDLIKEALCVRQELPLVVANSNSLGLESVQALLPMSVPMHVFDLSDPYPKKLDQLCTSYRRHISRIFSFPEE